MSGRRKTGGYEKVYSSFRSSPEVSKTKDAKIAVQSFITPPPTVLSLFGGELPGGPRGSISRGGGCTDLTHITSPDPSPSQIFSSAGFVIWLSVAAGVAGAAAIGATLALATGHSVWRGVSRHVGIAIAAATCIHFVGVVLGAVVQL